MGATTMSASICIYFLLIVTVCIFPRGFIHIIAYCICSYCLANIIRHAFVLVMHELNQFVRMGWLTSNVTQHVAYFHFITNISASNGHTFNLTITVGIL